MGSALPDDVTIRLRRRRERHNPRPRRNARLPRSRDLSGLRRPGSRRPRAGAEARRPHGARLGGIMMSTIERRPRIGAVLGAVGGVPSRPDPAPAQAPAPSPAPAPAPPEELPTIWDVDPALRPARSACAPPSRSGWRGPLRRTRPGSRSPAAAGASAVARLARPGPPSLAWPSDLPTADGAAFELRGAGAAAHERRIAFRRLASVPPDAAARRSRSPSPSRSSPKAAARSSTGWSRRLWSTASARRSGSRAASAAR